MTSYRTMYIPRFHSSESREPCELFVGSSVPGRWRNWARMLLGPTSRKLNSRLVSRNVAWVT